MRRTRIGWVGYSFLFLTLFSGCLPWLEQPTPTPTPKPPPIATATPRPSPTGTPTATASPTPSPTPTVAATKTAFPTPSGTANIVITTPRPGDEVSSPLHIEGLTRVFEGVVQIRLKDATGKVLVQARAQASAGTGTWGQFIVDLAFPMPSQPQQSRLELFSISPRDGSEVDLTVVTLKLAAR